MLILYVNVWLNILNMGLSPHPRAASHTTTASANVMATVHTTIITITITPTHAPTPTVSSVGPAPIDRWRPRFADTTNPLTFFQREAGGQIFTGVRPVTVVSSTGTIRTTN